MFGLILHKRLLSSTLKILW